MISEIQNIAIDCSDAYASARFWSAVTGCPLPPDAAPGTPELQLTPPAGPALYFQQVPEPKAVKNRLHLCLRPDTTRDEELSRLLALGATFLTDHRNPDGTGWAVLADPEGNEFCVLRSAGERGPE
ncbi:VOC family protein [Streptomyces sp. NPDC060194]|uniref:VOC family protein n=1 Tax=Streptomyces sp. NPDC060194 TaxID=3347069 RepID=UPI003659CF0A